MTNLLHDVFEIRSKFSTCAIWKLETLDLLPMAFCRIGTRNNPDIYRLFIIAARNDLGCMACAQCLVPGKGNTGDTFQQGRFAGALVANNDKLEPFRLAFKVNPADGNLT